MVDYEYYHDQYRYVPRNSANLQRDLADYHSAVSGQTSHIWSGSMKRPVTTNYINASTLLGLHERPYSVKDSFPRSKSRRKASAPVEKKINVGDVFMSLVPAEKSTVDSSTYRSDRNRSPLSMATGTQHSTFPDVQHQHQQRKSTDMRNNRVYSAAVYDDENSYAKYFGRSATTYANGAWVRRYKSINESHALTNLLRTQDYRDKLLLRKHSFYQPSNLSSFSKASFNSSSNNKHRLLQC